MFVLHNNQNKYTAVKMKWTFLVAIECDTLFRDYQLLLYMEVMVRINECVCCAGFFAL